MSLTEAELRPLLADIGGWTRLHPGHELRGYQLRAARAVLASIAAGRGGATCMVMARQAGKDETLAQLIGYLLMRHSVSGGSIVVVAPTAKPQAEITKSRVVDRLMQNPIARRVTTVAGDTVRIGRAKAVFLGQHGNIRGQTASLLLIGNEAQDIEPDRWDAAIEPMGASTNAPALFSGTVWTSDTLLAREMRHGAVLASSDGLERVARVPWREVAAELPVYGERVEARIGQFGASHPFIRTEYELIELDGDGGLFGAERQQLLGGTHPRQRRPAAGQRVAFLIDVAGADEDRLDVPGSQFDPEASRDSTALTVVEILDDEQLTRYRVLDRVAWTGVSWTQQRGAIRQLMRSWDPLVSVIDATGIGYGLWAWLAESEPRRRIEAFTFTSQSKSDLGWTLVGLIDSGRLTDYDASDPDAITAEFWVQVGAIQYAIESAHTRRMRWSVPSPGHDDLVLSLALVGALEDMELRPRVARGG